jgi:hypothetical protein
LSALPAAETVTALYDYEAQAEGDLSFSAGDVIEIVTRTANENEWWIGKIQGKQGQFPGEFSLSLLFGVYVYCLANHCLLLQATTSSSISKFFQAGNFWAWHLYTHVSRAIVVKPKH